MEFLMLELWNSFEQSGFYHRYLEACTLLDTPFLRLTRCLLYTSLCFASTACAVGISRFYYTLFALPEQVQRGRRRPFCEMCIRDRFMTDDLVGRGLPMFLPAGYTVWQELENYICLLYTSRCV